MEESTDVTETTTAPSFTDVTSIHGGGNSSGFVTPTKSMSFMTMATICTNVSCKQAMLHLNDSVTRANDMTGKDASWILTSAVIIFTMQTGKFCASTLCCIIVFS